MGSTTRQSGVEKQECYNFISATSSLHKHDPFIGNSNVVKDGWELNHIKIIFVNIQYQNIRE